MSNEIAVQEAVTDQGLLNADGTPTTAQQLYDAYMNGTVRILVEANGYVEICEPVWIRWTDSNGKATNPEDVCFVGMRFFVEDGLYGLLLGDNPLAPA